MTRPSLAVVLSLASLAQAAPPATGPTTGPQVGRRTQLLREQAGLPARPAVAVGQFLAINIAENFLAVRVAKPSDGSYAVRFTDWPGFAVVTEHGGMSAFTLTHSALSDHDTTETLTQVLTTPGRVQIARGVETAQRVTQIDLIQTRDPSPEDEPVQLLITDTPGEEGDAPAAPPIRLTAASFADLCRDHPAVVRQHLMPVFKDLGAAAVIRGSDPARAWQALGPYTPPDPATNARIDALFKRLAGDDFADRAKAEEELAGLGMSGAAELRRRDLPTLPPDVRAAAENALRRAEPLPPTKAQELSRDVPFLLDTLRLDDPKLVAAAAKQLTAVTGKPIDLPADLPRAEQEKRINSYTAALEPTTQPQRDNVP